MFSNDDPSLAAEKMRQIYLSQAAFGINLQDHKTTFLFILFRVKTAALGSLNKFSKLFSNVKGTSQNFDFSISQQKIVKTIRAYTYLKFYTFKNIHLVIRSL